MLTATAAVYADERNSI